MLPAAREQRAYLHFNRLDYPEMDPAAWHRWITVRQGEREMETGELPIAFWGGLEENYRPRHRENLVALEGGVARRRSA